MSILAIIPARYGSKGVPLKNIRKINGIHLIGYTIKEALKVSRFSDVIVSTESHDIGDIASSYGAATPFLRPAELSTDTSNIMDTVLYTIERFESMKIYYEHVALLQPTSPLRNSEDIDKALDIYTNNRCDSIVSVCEAEYHPSIHRKINNQGKLEEYIKQSDKHLRRQDMDKVYRINGAMYISSVNNIKKNKSFYGKINLPYIMDQSNSIDIDTELDFKIAKMLINDSGR